MPYRPLSLPDTEVGKIISRVTEPHLKQAHYLLAATFPNDFPSNHFGTSAAVMTLLTIAATSTIRHFKPEKNKKVRGDRHAFVDCVLKFFPWDQVTIEDDQYRAPEERRKIAAAELYDVFRNPLVHSGGATSNPLLSGKIGQWYRMPQIVHVYPGLASPQENESTIEQYCLENKLYGQTLLKLEAFSSTVYTRPLYWCTRKMIEAFAVDKEVQCDIARNMNVGEN